MTGHFFSPGSKQFFYKGYDEAAALVTSHVEGTWLAEELRREKPGVDLRKLCSAKLSR